MYPLRLVPIVLIAFSALAPAQKKLSAWHRDGQTFLVWEHSRLFPPKTYELWASGKPIISLSQATWLGRVFGDNGANHRLQRWIAGARWLLPGPGKASRRVGSREAYFVSTPHGVGKRYFAVSETGITRTFATIGPVAERIDPVTCHLQHKDKDVRILAHWIDGRKDHKKSRPGYPVMGNEWENGIGHNLAIWEPKGGRPALPAKLPLVVALHGGYGSLFAYGTKSPGSGTIYAGHPRNALLLTLDDSLRVGVLGIKLDINTFWLGHWRGLNRFAPSNPSATETVVDFTRRRALWEIRWVRDHERVDADRISLTGISMGGIGSALYAHTVPDMFSCVVPTVARFDLTKNQNPRLAKGVKLLFGSKAQGLKVAVASNPVVFDYFNPMWRLRNLKGSLPPVRWVFGRKDTRVLWADIAPVLPQMNGTGAGEMFYWDQREHIKWTGGHFFQATRIRAPAMTAYRASASWPGLYNVDVDLTKPGLQPDPGNGSAASGDAYGTWGGWIHWDPQLVLDRKDFWEAQLSIITGRAHSSEITNLKVIEATVSPKRRRLFRPAPLARVKWELRRRNDAKLLQSGTVSVKASGNIAVPGVRVLREPAVLRLFVAPATGRSPVNVDVRQPKGKGSIAIVNTGLRPRSLYINLMSTTIATDGIGTGWLFGLDPSLADLALLGSGMPPFVGLADTQGRARFTLPQGALPSFDLEILAFELDLSHILGANSGPRVFRLR